MQKKMTGCAPTSCRWARPAKHLKEKTLPRGEGAGKSAPFRYAASNTLRSVDQMQDALATAEKSCGEPLAAGRRGSCNRVLRPEHGERIGFKGKNKFTQGTVPLDRNNDGLVRVMEERSHKTIPSKESWGARATSLHWLPAPSASRVPRRVTGSKRRTSMGRKADPANRRRKWHACASKPAGSRVLGAPPQ